MCLETAGVTLLVWGFQFLMLLYHHFGLELSHLPQLFFQALILLSFLVLLPCFILDSGPDTN